MYVYQKLDRVFFRLMHNVSVATSLAPCIILLTIDNIANAHRILTHKFLRV